MRSARALLVLLAASAASAAPPPVTPAELAAHVRFLSSDLLEGRGPGTRGDLLAQEYLEAQLRLAGLAPAFGGGYRQEVPFRIVTPDASMRLTGSAAGRETPPATFGTDFVALFPRAETGGLVEGEVVFAGYGIAAAQWGWDDFAGLDARGKVLLVLAGEPGGDDPTLFEGPALTVHGRWMTKLEEAARRGALGVLLVHTREGAGYGWDVVRNSWGRPTPVDPANPELLPLQGWLTEPTAREWALTAGKDLAALRAAAGRRGFRAAPLGLKVRASGKPAYEPRVTANVAGLVRGSAPASSAPVVVVSAHHDHLGIGTPEGGDAIYNGALDNGSALAVLLSVARVLGARAGELPVDVLFLAPAGEEAGFLGSRAFVRTPPVPLGRMKACVNLEMSAVWGEARDLVAIGGRYSEVGDVVAAVARRNGLAVAPEPAPEQGFFFRSDQLSFARAGVPGVWLDLGDDLAGKPAGTGHALREAYRANRYHRPSDELDPAWELTGTAQLARVVVEVVEEIGRRGAIGWKPGAPYRR